MTQGKRVLIATLPVDYGKGVATHTQHVIRFLRNDGYSVTLAYYQPYSMAPSLSTPVWKLGRQSPGSRARTVWGDVPAREMGCWFPELEFTNHWPRREWKRLIAEHDCLLAVTGNPLAAHPFAASGRPYLAWIGTPFLPDREERVKHFPLVRRWLDRLVNTPGCLHYERVVLNSGTILPTTSYVAQEFRRLAPRARILDPVPVPVDTTFYCRGAEVPEEPSIFFTGKYNDPRKNILFLLDVVRECRDRGVAAILNLYGDEPGVAVRRHIARLGLEGAVRGLRKASLEELRSLYRASTVFAIASLQEGLCVAGLEAMACGCPVVTSPCGGPEDYVEDGRNGHIAPLEVGRFADAVCRVLRSREERSRLSEEAMRTISRRFSREVVERSFLEAFHQFSAGHPTPESGATTWSESARIGQDAGVQG